MGKTRSGFNALKNQENIDITGPEFTGTILATFLNEEAKINNEKKYTEQARKGLAKSNNEYEQLLEPMEFNNTYI